MTKKYVYAVAVGQAPGVYKTWEEAKKQITGYPGAKYKKFESSSQAEAFVKGNGSVILGQLGIKMETISFDATSIEPMVPCSFNSSKQSSPHSPDTIVAFTDGSSLNNGRKNARAGYAVVFPNHPDLNMSAALAGPNPTNNRAEYTALLQCLEIVENNIDKTGARKVVVYTDSKILLDSVTKWIKGWRKNGWKKSDGKPVLNRDLLEKIDEKMQRRRVEMHHVLAHTGRDDWKSKWNDMVDRMARSAASGETI